MALVAFQCGFCGSLSLKETGHVNRSRKKGAPIYCDRKCAGAARRNHKSAIQKTIEKRDYDKEYRAKNAALLKEKKARYFRKTYDPEAAAIARKKRMPAHIEYCRKPEYRAWKKQYDRKYRAKQLFGEFWESALLTLDIRTEALSRMTDYEIRLQNQTLNKLQTRKRDYEQQQSTLGPKLKNSSLGNLARRQERDSRPVTG